MKIVRLTEETNPDYLINFYLDSDGDVLFWPEVVEAGEWIRVTHRIIADHMYPGTVDDWRRVIRGKLIDLKLIERDVF